LHDFTVGGEITYRGRAYRIRGISPMGAVERRVLLEDVVTHEQIEVTLDELREAQSPPDGPRLPDPPEA
jgi:hypothetical protein